MIIGKKHKYKKQSLVVKFLKLLKFKILVYEKHKNANGPDIVVLKNNTVFKVEIKKPKVLPSGSFQVPPVEPLRKSDDLIAIIINDKYVLIEPMEHHLKNCSAKGYRVLTYLK